MTETRNARLARLAGLTHEFLARYAGMPDVAQVTADAFDRPIRFQLWGSGITGLATWAQELGTPLRMTDFGNYVHCSTATEEHGEKFELWNHLNPLEAYKLLYPMGIEPTKNGVEVDPALLLEAPSIQAESTEDGAS